MTSMVTNTDFGKLSWHDNALYGFRLEPPDPDTGDWRSDLILSIDHIVEWVPQKEGRMRFRVAPALLTFHDVNGLSIAVDWEGQSLQDMAISGIERRPMTHPTGNPSLVWYRWRILLNWPTGGTLHFDASGFTQKLLSEPLLLTEQALSPTMRRNIVPAADA